MPGQNTFAGHVISRPRAVGRYVLGNGDLGHHFYLTRKPGRIERFFARRLLGLTWVDSAC